MLVSTMPTSKEDKRVSSGEATIMPDSHLDNKSNIFHHNNKNNQLEKWVQPPKDNH